MMNDQPMPETIKELVQNPQVTDAGNDKFIRNFDIRPNVILYHTHVDSNKKQHVFVNNSEQDHFHGITRKHGWTNYHKGLKLKSNHSHD